MTAFNHERKTIRDHLLSGSFDFDEMAMRVFHFQFEYNELYQVFCRHLDRTPQNVQSPDAIPFLPVRFFKSHEVKTGRFQPRLVFKSSGTTEMSRSQHLVRDPELYEQISSGIFEQVYSSLEEYIILALLPSYLEQGDSSLVYMVKTFMEKTNHASSTFYRYDYDRLRDDFLTLIHGPRKIILWGVTYAMMDLAERYDWGEISGPKLDDRLILMETGGMKGRREELIRSEVHDTLQSAFGVRAVHSEYGMTEMMSQGYSKGHGIFEMSRTMRILAFDAQDPLTFVGDGPIGRCHVVDLSNVDSCSFIGTDDVCRTNGKKFEIIGRLDHSDVRGCNLLYRQS